LAGGVYRGQVKTNPSFLEKCNQFVHFVSSNNLEKAITELIPFTVDRPRKRPLVEGCSDVVIGHLFDVDRLVAAGAEGHFQLVVFQYETTLERQMYRAIDKQEHSKRLRGGELAFLRSSWSRPVKTDFGEIKPNCFR
jgi:hypothetical protein